MDYFNGVKNECDIIQVYQDLTNNSITDAGPEIKIRCPLPGHKDKHPSAVINRVEGLYHCFVCNKGGSVIDLVKDVKGISVKKATRWLLERYNIETDNKLTKKEKMKPVKNKQQSLLKKIIEKNYNNLEDKHRQLLHDRGITDKTIEEHKIGFCPEVNKNEIKALKTNKPKGYKKLKSLGLIGKGDYYLPGGRIIIPIWRYEKPIYWVAWDPYYKDKNNNIKYIKPKGLDTPLIFNNKSDGPTYIVEGIFDYLSMVESELNVICTLGKSLKSKYIKRLKMIENIDIIIAFDNDVKDNGSNPGQEGAEIIANNLWPDIKAKLLKCPENEDINDIFKKYNGNKNLFLKRLKNLPEETILERYIFQIEKAKGEKKHDKANLVYPLIKQLRGEKQDTAEKMLQIAFGGKRVVSLDYIHKNVLSAKINGKINKKDDWPDPIPLDEIAVNSLPVEILPDWIKNHVKSLADFTQTPVDMGLLLSLSAIATALAKKGIITVKQGYKEPLNIWTTTVLPPANRKSAVFKNIIKPIYNYEKTLAQEIESERRHAIEEKEILEGRQKKLEKKAINSNDDKNRAKIINEVKEIGDDISELDIPNIPRLVTSDITTEKLAQLMSENNGRIAILSPEGELFQLMAGRYSKSGNSNFENYKKGWTGGEPIRDDRMGRDGTHVKNPALTQGLTIQPTVLEELNNKKSFKGEGLLGRYLYAIPKSLVGNRLTGADVPELDIVAEKRFKKGMKQLLSSKPKETIDSEWKPHELRLSSEALKIRNKFEAAIENKLREGGELSNIPDWGGKLVGNITRVAGLLHIADQIENIDDGSVDIWNTLITDGAMERAVKLGYRLIPHALKVYDLLDADPEIALARYVLKKIKKFDNKSNLTIRELHRVVQNKKAIKTIDDLKEVLNLLVDHYYISIITQKNDDGPGRYPSPIIRLNPIVQ